MGAFRKEVESEVSSREDCQAGQIEGSKNKTCYVRRVSPLKLRTQRFQHWPTLTS